MILLYTILIFVFFALDGTDIQEDHGDIFYYIEIVILFIFSIEITLQTIALGKIYLCDPWNIFDLIIIILSVAFVFMEIYIESKALRGFLRIRGIFRLLRIFILIRKLDALKEKKEISKKKRAGTGYRL